MRYKVKLPTEEALPEAVSSAVMTYRRYVLEKIERGRRDVEAGRVVSQEEVERRMDRWIHLDER